MEKDQLKDDIEDFAACVEAESEQRKQSEDDLEFALLEKQWSEDDRSQREKEGRPCLTINRLPSFGKQVTNDARMNRASINVKPVGGGADKATADIQSDLIRNIETQSQANIVYDTAFHFAVYGGRGYFRVNVDYTDEDAWDQDIMLSRIANPFSVYGDHESTEATSIDWNRAYVTDFYSKSAFEARWGKDRKAGSFEVGSGDYDANWFKDKRIRVAERWLREEVMVKLLKLSNGAIMFEREYLKNQDYFDQLAVTVEGDRETKSYKVKQRLITGTDVLEENDWLGKYIPIVPMYGEEVNIGGKRYFISLIHRIKDAQRYFNFWRSSTAEALSMSTKAPWLVAEGQIEGYEPEWQTANRVNHPYLKYNQVDGVPPPIRLTFAGVPAGALQESLMASDDMKDVIGMHDASLGARSNETSGRAIMARQREGDTSTFDFIDNRNRAVEHGGRIVLDLIPKLYTAERILRCVQEDGSTYTVPVNQPVAPKRELEKLMAPPQMPMRGMSPGMQPGMPQGPMQPGMNPMGQPEQEDEQQGPPEYAPIPPEAESRIPPEQLKAITKIFDLTSGKYDVMVTAGPGFNTRREEAATQMMEFIRVFPQAAPLIGDLLAKNLDWPGAEQVAERLKAMLPPQAAGKVNPMVQKLQGMLQQQDAQAKEAVATLQKQISDLIAQLKDKSAEQELKDKELGIKGFEAWTRREEALKPEAVQPQQIDPFKAQELELAEREQGVKDYEAITERLKVLAAALPPEAFAALVMKTTGEAMAPLGEAMPGCDMPGMPPDPMMVAMMQEPQMMDAMPMEMMGEMQAMPDGSMMPGPPMDGMGGMQMPMDQQTMPPDGMTQ